MIAKYLLDLPISDEERKRLSMLGAPNAKALLEARKASKEAFDQYIGPDRADAVALELEKLLSPEDRASLAASPKPAGRLGARLSPLPGIPKKTDGQAR